MTVCFVSQASDTSKRRPSAPITVTVGEKSRRIRAWDSKILRQDRAPSTLLVIREAVASFPDREHFHRAVADLSAAGFDTGDLSVLASHDSLAAAGEPPAGQPRLLPAGLADEIKYIAPLTVAGIILLSGGPITAGIAALVGAGLGGAALKELFDDYTAPQHAGDFQAALQAGAALLWVRCEDSERELTATRILEEAGGRHVHVHGRPPQTAGRGA